MARRTRTSWKPSSRLWWSSARYASEDCWYSITRRSGFADSLSTCRRDGFWTQSTAVPPGRPPAPLRPGAGSSGSRPGALRTRGFWSNALDSPGYPAQRSPRGDSPGSELVKWNRPGPERRDPADLAPPRPAAVHPDRSPECQDRSAWAARRTGGEACTSICRRPGTSDACHAIGLPEELIDG